MATKTNDKAIYMNIDPAKFGVRFAALCAKAREIYDADKAIKAQQATFLNDACDLPDGYVVRRVVFTRWGQMQAICEPGIASPKPKAKSSRPSLDDWLKDTHNSR